MAWARRRARRRLRPEAALVLAALAVAACAAPSPRPPEQETSNQAATLLQSLPPASAAGAARSLAVLPQSSAPQGAPARPVIVRGTAPPAPPASAPPAAAGDADITLNFSGADIRDVVASVLGETLKLNYVIDADVAGPITFNVSRPLRRDEVLPALEAVLRAAASPWFNRTASSGS